MWAQPDSGWPWVTPSLAGDQAIRRVGVEEAEVEARDVVFADVDVPDLGARLEVPAQLLDGHRLPLLAHHRGEHPRAALAEVLGDGLLLLRSDPVRLEAADAEVEEDVEAAELAPLLEGRVGVAGEEIEARG